MAYRNRSFVRALTFAIALATGGSAVQAEEAWPTRQITFVIPFGTGGSVDRSMRLLAEQMQHELEVPIRVVNQKGGGGHVGTTYFLSQPTDGSFFLATAIHPYISNAILEFQPDYDLGDFAFINGQWTDVDLFAINKDLPFATLQEFMQAVKEEPGRYRVSVVTGSTGEINIQLALEAFGLPADAVNIVTYEGGGTARTAVAGGQVDMTVISASGSLPVAEFIRPLAVASAERLEDWDAPTLNETLADRGVTLTPLAGSMRGVAANAVFAAEHPQEFDRFVAAYETVLQDEDFVAQLHDQNIGADWLGPERTTEMVLSNFDILSRFAKPD
ncbi:Bug family tripartite tricarboxylate transporter substrate binding protein [Antarcticimicrobium sediminis]|uniref:Tripartite tricarboxylate transporter substrate binding protein n=1 Tax=Antarcticimicrobium sediminis TaxID=2546227 RepID=A0A4R5EJA0_9RHOB|nr:tripartite tricarboxylate transporter substrate binding protein [Antarcticimicrobium sediminis]TDE34645.1 tripartite tricarboxylate transporter substrate binding protein [Antarcticimicrobium sediminis]